VSGVVSPGLLPRRCQHLAHQLEQARPAGALLFGLLLSLLVMPACPLCGAGLITLAAVVAAKNLVWYGIAIFVSFALGQGLPIVAVGVLTTIVKPELVNRLRTRLCSIDQRVQLLCGNLLMVLGLYFIIVG
jgi:cytochrome c biogenesis protein CcdA